jgi:hypothetical protein
VPQDLTLLLSTLADGSVTTNDTLNVTGHASDTGSGIKSVTVNGQQVTVDGGNFSTAVTLSDGANKITVVAANNVGIMTSESRTITRDQTAPIITITAPADNCAVNKTTVDVTGSVNENTVVTVTVNKMAAQTFNQDGTSFTATVNLAVGLNTIQVTATDQAQKTATVKRTVIYNPALPALAITDPAQDITTKTNPLTLHGMFSAVQTPVTVSISHNDKNYTPTVTDNTFQQQISFTTARQYPIFFTATDAGGTGVTVQRNIIFIGVIGDVNNDTIVNVFDALQVLRYAVGLDKPADEASFIIAADVAPLVNGKPKGDGKVNVFDALAILRHAVGLDPW